ncbi:MAG: SDR family NAD(P)-dependent oxidoreductase [Gammaproteobacteria bacterium]
MRRASGFRRVGVSQFEIRPASPQDYAELIKALGPTPPDRIAHLWSLAECEGEKALDLGFHSLMYLIQSCITNLGNRPLRIGVAAIETEQVLGVERIVAEKAAAQGIAGAVSAEYPQISLFHADLTCSELSPSGTHEPAWVSMFLGDMARPEVNGVVAYRGTYRWKSHVETFDPRCESDSNPAPLREHGVYLITGGLGRIGLTLAEWLGRNFNAKLALVSRRRLPPTEQLAEISSSLPDDPLTTVMTRVEALRRDGVEILTFCADVTDEVAMKSVVADIMQRFDAIHGVIHAASASAHGRFRMIAQTNEADWKNEIAPKLEGTRVLRKVLRAEIDFCLVNGSITSVVGGKGSSVESAAHLAALASTRESREPYPFFFVDWEHWALHRHHLNEGSTGHVLFNLDLAAQNRFSMAAHEGLTVFRQILGLPGSERIVVSSGDITIRRRDMREAVTRINVPMPVREKFTANKNPTRHSRPDLATPYAEPDCPLHRSLCDIWAEIIGIDRVGIHDNFFDLGGDSLLFLRFTTRLPALKAVPIAAMFGSPTVEQIAGLLKDAAVRSLPEASNSSSLGSTSLNDASDVQSARPSAAAPSILSNQFVVDAQAGALQKKNQMSRVYNAVTRQLNQSGLAPYAIFLNYGYKENHLPQRATIQLPERLLNRNCIKLVVELFGACNLDANTRFLDIGCGRGGTISVLRSYFDAKEAYGLDLSPDAVAFNRRTHRWPDTHFLQGDAENLPFPDAYFNVVTNVESSHSYPDLRAFYREVFRVLTPEGRFLYTDLFPVNMAGECVAYLQALGFTLLDEKDITSNVLASCDEIGAAHFHAFADGNDAEALANFLGVPGSKIYNDIQQGYSTYRLYDFKK